MKRLKDFPIDHSGVQVMDTPKMADVAARIQELQTEYELLKEQEQRRLWAEFLRVVRSNAQARERESIIPAWLRTSAA